MGRSRTGGIHRAGAPSRRGRGDRPRPSGSRESRPAGLSRSRESGPPSTARPRRDESAPSEGPRREISKAARGSGKRNRPGDFAVASAFSRRSRDSKRPTAGDGGPYYEAPNYVRHSFRTVEKGVARRSEFSPTTLTSESRRRIARERLLCGLRSPRTAARDQITTRGARSQREHPIRVDRLGPPLSAARLDDDALRFVADSCRATRASGDARGRSGEPPGLGELAKERPAREGALRRAPPEDVPPRRSREISPRTSIASVADRAGRPAAKVPVPEAAATAKKARDRGRGATGPRRTRKVAEPARARWRGRPVRITDLNCQTRDLAAYRTRSFSPTALRTGKSRSRGRSRAGLTAEIFA